MGCDCDPAIRGAAPERIKEVGAVDGLMIRHERGCPLGDVTYEYNLLGIVPAIWAPAPSTGCER